MNEYLSAAVRFKWRVMTYFFATLFATLGGSFSTSTAETNWQQWIIACFLALGSAFGSVRALLDQSVDTTTPNEKQPSP